jgi:flagellar basal-body rod modification protein FlgD
MLLGPTSNASGVDHGFSNKSQAKLNEDMSSFLLMLTTELKHQDPTSPLETKDFTQQLIGFSTVEQQITVNHNLEKLVAAYQDAPLNNAAAYIGKEVAIDYSSAKLIAEQPVDFGYALGGDASIVEMEVLNGYGQVVYTKQMYDVEGGNHTFKWSGLNSKGEQCPEGIYRFYVKARDKQDVPVQASTAVSGIVSAATLRHDQPMLMIDDKEVALSKVVAVAYPEINHKQGISLLNEEL